MPLSRTLNCLARRASGCETRRGNRVRSNSLSPTVALNPFCSPAIGTWHSVILVADDRHKRAARERDWLDSELGRTKLLNTRFFRGFPEQRSIWKTGTRISGKERTQTAAAGRCSGNELFDCTSRFQGRVCAEEDSLPWRQMLTARPRKHRT